jgi:hypothetical protein
MKRPQKLRYPTRARAKAQLQDLKGLEDFVRKARFPKELGFRLSMDLIEVRSCAVIIEDAIRRLAEDTHLSFLQQSDLLHRLKFYLYQELPNYAKRVRRHIIGARRLLAKHDTRTEEDFTRESRAQLYAFRRKTKRWEAQRLARQAKAARKSR